MYEAKNSVVPLNLPTAPEVLFDRLKPLTQAKCFCLKPDLGIRQNRSEATQISFPADLPANGRLSEKDVLKSYSSSKRFFL